MHSISLEPYTIQDIVREFRKLHGLALAGRVYLFVDEAAYRQRIHQQLKNLYSITGDVLHKNAKISSLLSQTQ